MQALQVEYSYSCHTDTMNTLNRSSDKQYDREEGREGERGGRGEGGKERALKTTDLHSLMVLHEWSNVGQFIHNNYYVNIHTLVMTFIHVLFIKIACTYSNYRSTKTTICRLQAHLWSITTLVQ